jgi:hypothetical protein
MTIREFVCRRSNSSTKSSATPPSVEECRSMNEAAEMGEGVPAGPGARRRRAIVAAVTGNALEWYDFVVYALLSGTIGKLFFPVGGEPAFLLLSCATFGVALVMRPVGAFILGFYADRVGCTRGQGKVCRSLSHSHLPMVCAAAALIFLFAGNGPVRAHDWYPIECCARNDCRPAGGVDVNGRGGMDVIVGDLRIGIPEDFATRLSPDNRIHICFRTYGDTDGSITVIPICLFLPGRV